MFELIDKHLSLTQEKVDNLKSGDLLEKLKLIQLNAEKARLIVENDHEILSDYLNKNHSSEIEKIGEQKIEEYMKAGYLKILQSFAFLK